MGKKAKFKKIRSLASAMPVINSRAITGVEVVSGGDVLKSGIKEVGGQPINPDKIYKKKIVGNVPINHNRNMKKQYYKNGVAGVNGYVQAVQRFVSSRQATNI